MLFKCVFMFEMTLPPGQNCLRIAALCCSGLLLPPHNRLVWPDSWFWPPANHPEDSEEPLPGRLSRLRVLEENGDTCERDLGSTMQLCSLATLLLLLLLLLPTVLDGRSVHLQRKSRRAFWQPARPCQQKRQPAFGLLFRKLGFLPGAFHLFIYFSALFISSVQAPFFFNIAVAIWKETNRHT